MFLRYRLPQGLWMIHFRFVQETPLQSAMWWGGKSRECTLLVSGFGFRVSGFGFRVSGFGFRFSGVRFRVSGFGLRVSGFGLRVSGFRFWVSGFGSRRKLGAQEMHKVDRTNHTARYESRWLVHRKSVTLSVGTLLRLYGNSCHRTDGLSHSGLFKKLLCGGPL